MSFERAFKQTVGIEGKYSNNPVDKGGETMYGITARVARANGYTGPMRDMPLSVAHDIYRRQYWGIINLDAVDQISEHIAEEMFDTGVNMHPSVPAKFLQRSLNVLNRGASDFSDIEVDGLIGPVTLAALRAFLDFRGDKGLVVLLRMLDGLQAVRYIEIAEADPTQETFMFGWIWNRIGERR